MKNIIAIDSYFQESKSDEGYTLTTLVVKVLKVGEYDRKLISDNVKFVTVETYDDIISNDNRYLLDITASEEQKEAIDNMRKN